MTQRLQRVSAAGAQAGQRRAKESGFGNDFAVLNNDCLKSRLKRLVVSLPFHCGGLHFFYSPHSRSRSGSRSQLSALGFTFSHTSRSRPSKPKGKKGGPSSDLLAASPRPGRAARRGDHQRFAARSAPSSRVGPLSALSADKRAQGTMAEERKNDDDEMLSLALTLFSAPRSSSLLRS